MVLADGQLHIAHLGDVDRVRDGLWHFGEDAAHFGLGLQVEFLRRILHAALIREAGAGLDAQHRVVRDVIRRIDVVDVVSGDDAEVEFRGELEEVGDDAFLLLEAMVHELDDEVLATKDLHEPPARLARGFVVALE